MKFDKGLIPYGIGAAVGVVVPSVLKQYYNVPIIPQLNKWGTSSTFIPIVAGALAFAIPNFTKVVKNKKTKNFLTLFGITSMALGLLNGISATPPAGGLTAGFNKTNAQRMATHYARYGTTDLPTRGTGRYFGPYTPGGEMTSTYYPSFTGDFYRRPMTRAQGYGSDVTRNPMAIIPTKVSTGTILA